MLKIVHEYAKPQRLYPVRTSPKLPNLFLGMGKPAKTVEEFIIFCRAHQLTSDDFDRPFEMGLSLFTFALVGHNLSLIRHMVAERLKSMSASLVVSASYFACSASSTSLQSHSPPSSWDGSEGNDNLPAPNLLYAKLAVIGDNHHTVLQLHIQFLNNSDDWLRILDFILEEAPYLVNLSDDHSPLHMWLNLFKSGTMGHHRMFERALLSETLPVNTTEALRRLINAGALFSSDPQLRIIELRIMKQRIVLRYFKDVFGREYRTVIARLCAQYGNANR
jgi:hypothetical protein